VANSSFPADFLWGAATSAYQVEGSPLADGAGPSIWHRFSHQAGKIAGGDTGEVACDHYRRFAEDVCLMRELGIAAYRFSISWSRVLPDGTGRINQPGIDFYRRLVDTLLENQIQPMATLYHWDLPAALEDSGGWADPRSVGWFTEYAETMFRALGDRVPLWCTLNEPWVVVNEGYVDGRHAPGRRNCAEAAAVSKNLSLAHSSAVAAYRAIGKQKIGLVLNLTPVHPATNSNADLQAAKRHDAYLNLQFLDPAILGQYPPEFAELKDGNWTNWSAEELKQARQPIDFIGVNYYLRIVVRDDPSGGLTRTAIVPQPDVPHTAMGWEIYPRGLTDILLWLNERYGNLPLYITENGAAYDDVLSPNGTISDTSRVQYLIDHLRAAEQAIRAGANLRGYYVWSLLDNFEWACGYSKRFGIVHVDYKSQRRTPKASARFYSNVIRSNGAVLRDDTDA
jgi:beta-glucosidase